MLVLIVSGSSKFSGGDYWYLEFTRFWFILLIESRSKLDSFDFIDASFLSSMTFYDVFFGSWKVLVPIFGVNGSCAQSNKLLQSFSWIFRFCKTSLPLLWLVESFWVDIYYASNKAVIRELPAAVFLPLLLFYLYFYQILSFSNWFGRTSYLFVVAGGRGDTRFNTYNGLTPPSSLIFIYTFY